MARALDLIGDWWSLLIVRDAFDGVRRFGGFQKSLGIARGMLSARLQALVEAGVLELAPAPNGGAHHEYALTAKGRALFVVIVALRQWGEDHLFAPREARSTLVDLSRGAAVKPLQVRAADDRVLGPDDVTVEKVAAARKHGSRANRPSEQGER